jgi:CheY-like chemotaxis protein
LAEDDDSLREMLQAALERDGFDVVAVANVNAGLGRIAAEHFDVLLSDFHMPQAGDGFTVISAMQRHHPEAVTLALSGYPELYEALSAIRSQADGVLVRPIELVSLREVIHDRLADRACHKPLFTESVASILEQALDATIQSCMKLVENNEEGFCLVSGLGQRFVLHAEDVFANVGPELLEDVRAGSNNNLCGEVLGGFAETAFSGRVIQVRESGF